MLAVFDNTVATVEIFLISIPESLGLLVFGVGLMLIAVFLRRMLARTTEMEETTKSTDEAFGNR